MSAQFERVRRILCTFKDCDLSFLDEKSMKRHKRNADEHEYCHLCDEDFSSIEDFVQHKITRPFEHKKACRVCGDEFKSESGLNRHIELSHKVNQKLTCIGCQKSFYRACLFIEHLEFGHCDVIGSNQFEGHIVHKHLIDEFLKDGAAYIRFKQKMSKYEAAVDYEEEGGVNLGEDPLETDENIQEVEFTALKPDAHSESQPSQALANVNPFPPLPSQVGQAWSEVALGLGTLSISGQSDASTIVGSPSTATLPHPRNTESYDESSVNESSMKSTRHRPKAWGSRSGKTASNILFPNAEPTPTPREFSIDAHDEAIEEQQGINIMRTRFWDPMSSDWNPEKFYDSVVCKYSCPFDCEQTFDAVCDLNKHILTSHRVTRMKCPTCLKYFKSATALVSHCESRGANCQISKATDFNLFLDRISGGFLAVHEKIRPDHMNNAPVLVTNPRTHRIDKYRAPVVKYLQYTVTTPPDWKEPVREGFQVGSTSKVASLWN